MKKHLAAAAAVLFVICFAGGCVRDAAPELPTEPLTVTERTVQVTEETAETTALPETTTEPETATEPETTTTAPALTETSAASTTTGTVQESTAAAESNPAPTSAKEETTTAKPDPTTAVPIPAQTQTTRQSLIDRLRTFRDAQNEPKPDPAFFDDAVFVGDSVTMGLRNYTTSQRNKGKTCLGTAQFLCYGSMSYTNALEPVSANSMHPSYKGKKVKIEEGVQLCGAKKVFIMLGMNDFAAYSEKAWKKNVCTLIDRILEKNPGVSIYLQSVTPILAGKERGRFNNTNIQAFNDYLRQVCSERGYTYVDIYSVLADETGHLKKSCCGDAASMGIHMSNTGSAAWANKLQTTFCGE